jgi:hypothetical protein
MNKLNVFIVLSIVATASLFAGIAMVTPVLEFNNSSTFLIKLLDNEIVF